mgnify:CR=1 FL=1
MTNITVRDENSTAYAIIHMPSTERHSPMVEYFRSTRVKRPERFLTREPEAAIQRRFDAVNEHKARVAERRKSRSGERELQVGDILYSSWGYNMTHADFYRVTKLVGKQSVEVEALSNKTVTGDGGWSGTAAPDLEQRGSKLEGRFRVTNGSTIKISYSQYASKWDGRPKYFNTMD